MSGLCIIGDVHGEMFLLDKLIRKVPSDVEFVFVGDLVNRGPQTREVLDFVGNLVREGAAAVVMGNHERALLRFLNDGEFVPFAHHGGAATIRSYVGLARSDVHQHFTECFPLQHQALVQGFLPVFETRDLIVTHAGIDPHLQTSTVETLKSDHTERVRPFLTEKFVVVGHFPQRQVHRRGKSIYVDTGCGYGGPLSCLLWPEGDVFSVSKL
jgi:serine/threonine protein phosphatase 1